MRFRSSFPELIYASSDGVVRNISGANEYERAITLSGATRINSDADTLTLSGANTYTGKTTVSAGTLALSTSVLLTSGEIEVTAAGLLDVSGTEGSRFGIDSRDGISFAMPEGIYTLVSGTVDTAQLRSTRDRGARLAVVGNHHRRQQNAAAAIAPPATASPAGSGTGATIAEVAVGK